MRRSMTVALVAAFLMSAGARAQTETLPERVTRLERELSAIKEQIKRTTSNPGQQGAKGVQGERGPQGPPGPKGDKGELGPAATLSVPGASFSEGQLELKGNGSAVINGGVGGTGSGGGYALFSNIDKKNVAYLGSSSDKGGIGLLKLWTKSGAQVIELQAADIGGWARFRDKTGQEVAAIGTASDGKGVLKINGESVKDYAEVFDLARRQGVTPGTVMAVVGPGARIAPADNRYERRVVGVISGAGGLQPGAVIGSREDGSNDLPLAVSGQVYVRVCLEGGPIEPGDLLVASSQSGVAMRAADLDQATGAVVGKALEAFGPGHGREGLVRMIVMLR